MQLIAFNILNFFLTEMFCQMIDDKSVMKRYDKISLLRISDTPGQVHTCMMFAAFLADMAPTDTCSCEQNGNKCYCHYGTAVTWYTAEAACEANGAYLAIVNDQMEHDYLMSVMYRSHYIPFTYNIKHIVKKR